MPCFPRHGFISGLALLLSIAFAQQAFPQTSVGPSAPQTAAARHPLRILALGDSVMWGQGLRDENKFSYKLRDWLCKQRGGGVCQSKEDVQLHVEAHSGAVIGEPERDRDKAAAERFIREVAPVRYYGEVNNGYPTVGGQIKLARRHYEKNSIPLSEVDLVILNGGINDLNAATLLMHKLLGGDVTKQVNEHFAPMPGILEKVAETFPNARIVVTGYFPLVSEATPETILRDTIKDWLSVRDAEKAGMSERLKEWLAARKAEKELVEESIEDEEERTRRGERGDRRKNEAGIILALMAARSREFVTASNNALEMAVKGLNQNSKFPPLPTVRAGDATPPPEATMRALFVGVNFEPKHAYGTKDSYL
jgi:lysophospholipase L1-like esterase